MLDVAIKTRLGGTALDVAFQAEAGVTVLFGASGAGKTSVINAIAGLLRPDAGRIALGDCVLFDDKTDRPPHKRKVGYVFQDARLFPHMSVQQNLTYGSNHDFDRLVDLLGLRALLDRRPTGLSGGERQRVALGRAVMSAPEVLLMDEPLAALDGPRKADLLPYLRNLAATTGIPMIYVTHAMAEVIALADQIVILEAGKVACAGSLDTIMANPRHAHYFARRDRGAVVSCTVARHDEGLTVLASPAGDIFLPGAVGQTGTALRLAIPAQDVMLSQKPLEGQSALNVLAAEIVDILPLQNGNHAVVLRADQAQLWAEVTPVSVTRMGLQPGQAIHAVFKATAIGPT